MSEFAVEMRGITKVFGSKKANDNVDFFVRKGSIHGLLGENGAGKTTLMNILYGLYAQEEGEIFINGEKVDIDSPLKAIRLGIGMVHQHFMLAKPLTVTENVMLGKKSRRGILLDTKETAAELQELSDKYRMDIDPYAKIWQLSVGEQQRVEILSALYMGADILILDEPTAVLTPQETEVFFDSLRQMRDNGKSIILITHKLEEILSTVDEVTVLRDGKMVDRCEVNGSVTRDDLSRMMVGRDVTFDYEKPEREPGEVRLSLKNINALNDKGLPAVTDFALDIREGEILGLAGVDGNGQKELCEVLTGLRRAESGEILYEGENIINRHPGEYIGRDMAHIPEDRQNLGLAMGWALKNNLVFKKLDKAPFSKKGFLDMKAIENNWQDLQKRYDIKAGSGTDSARSLSGGNQQKLIVARELGSAPKVLIANQPTRGVDIGASEYVRGCILDARNSGASVLLITADMEELLQLSDRIAVIYGGQLMGILPGGSDPLEIGKMMMGMKQEVKA